MRRKVFLLTGTAAAAVSVAGRAAALPNGFAQQLTLGVAVPLSGDAARSGELIASGARAAIDRINSTTGMLATAFGMRTFDDQGAVAVALTNAQFAASDPSIIAMIGHFHGDVTIAVLPTYAGAGMPLVVPTATADEITQRGYRNVFRLPSKDNVEGRLFAGYIAAEKKAKSAVAVTQDGDYGYGVAQGFVRGAALDKLSADAYVFPFRSPDFSAAARAILTKKPDFIYLCGKTADMGPLIPALRSAGYAGGFGASDGFFNLQTADKYGAAFEGALFSSSFPPLDRAPADFQLLADFRGRYGQVSALSAFGYAAAQVVMDAARRTGATNRLTMLSALRTGGSYNTLVGSFSFDANGDPIEPNVYLYSLSGGKFKFLRAARPTSFIL